MTLPPDGKMALIRFHGPGGVSDITGYKSKSHLERLEELGQFPPSVKIGPRAKAWFLPEVNEWIQAKLLEFSESQLEELLRQQRIKRGLLRNQFANLLSQQH